MSAVVFAACVLAGWTIHTIVVRPLLWKLQGW